MNLAILGQSQWTFGVNDPSIFAWLIFAAFFLAACFCWLASRSPEGHDLPRRNLAWVLMSIILVVLGINKQLDLHQLVLDYVRELFASTNISELSPVIWVAIAVVAGSLTVLAWRVCVTYPFRFNRHLFFAFGALIIFLGAQVVRFLPGPTSRLLVAHVFSVEEGLFHLHVIELIELGSLMVIGFFARATLHRNESLADGATTARKHVLMLLENAGIPEDHRVVREAEALCQAGFQVSIICPASREQKWSEKLRGIQIYRFPESFSPSGFAGYIWEYGYSIAMFSVISFYVLIRRGFDVVHVHTPPDMTSVVAVIYQLFGKKFVFDHHDLSPELYLARRGNDTPNLAYKILRAFERLACCRADRLIATNLTQQAAQKQRGGAKPERCYIVRNGPDESFLKSVEPNVTLLRPGKLLLGYVGVIGIQDGVDYMIRVVRELKFTHRRSDFQAVIVGYGTALDDLKLLARELDVEEEIHFTGRVPFATVPPLIKSFDICFTPDPSNSYNDSCTTIKTMEYMSLSKPTVCFRTKENQFTAGDAALYAENNDIAEFAKLTIRLMDDPDLREKMGRLARQRIDDGLTWQRQAMQLVKLYSDLF